MESKEIRFNSDRGKKKKKKQEKESVKYAKSTNQVRMSMKTYHGNQQFKITSLSSLSNLHIFMSEALGTSTP